MSDLVQQVWVLISQHAWLPLAALAIGALVRVAKSDVPIPFWNVPAKYRAWLAIGLGVVYGVVDSLVKGVPLMTSLLQGLAAAMVAITGHETIVEGLRGGRDIGVSKAAMLAGQRGCALLRPVFALGISVMAVGLLAFAVHGCSGVKLDPKTVATIDDAALALCKLWAAENIPAGKTVEQVIAEVCMAANTLQPFKDETMAAKGRVGARLALARSTAMHSGDAGK